MDNEKVYQMEFGKIYQLLVNKAVKKGRTKEEVDEVIRWLTGYSQEALDSLAGKTDSCTYGDFFRNAPQMNEKRRWMNWQRVSPWRRFCESIRGEDRN